jgi:hypothetical protein
MASKTTEFAPEIHLVFKGYAASCSALAISSRNPALAIAHLLFKGYAANCFALAISSRDPALAIAHPYFSDSKGHLCFGTTQNRPNPEVAPFSSIEKMQLLCREVGCMISENIGRGQQELSSNLY